jgi:hypothetical protein
MNDRSKVRRIEDILPPGLIQFNCLMTWARHFAEKADLRLFVAEELTSGRHKRLLQRAKFQSRES